MQATSRLGPPHINRLVCETRPLMLITDRNFDVQQSTKGNPSFQGCVCSKAPLPFLAAGCQIRACRRCRCTQNTRGSHGLGASSPLATIVLNLDVFSQRPVICFYCFEIFNGDNLWNRLRRTSSEVLLHEIQDLGAALRPLLRRRDARPIIEPKHFGQIRRRFGTQSLIREHQQRWQEKENTE